MQTKKQTNKQIYLQTKKQTNKQIYLQTKKQTKKQIYLQTNKQIYPYKAVYLVKLHQLGFWYVASRESGIPQLNSIVKGYR